MLVRTIFVAALSVCAWAQTPEAAGFSPERLQRLHALLERKVADRQWRVS